MHHFSLPLLTSDAFIIVDLLRQGLNQADTVFRETGARLAAENGLRKVILISPSQHARARQSSEYRVRRNET